MCDIPNQVPSVLRREIEFCFQGEWVHEKSPKKRITISIVLFFLYEILTFGGPVIMSSSRYEWQGSEEILDSVQVHLYLEPHHTEIYVPLLFTYMTEGGPYNLQIEIWDRHQKVESITIDQIRINYGEFNQRNKPKDKIINCRWNRDLQKKVVYHSQKGKGRIETELMALSDSIENVLEFHQPCTISLTGHLKLKDGTIREIRLSQKLVPTSYLRIATWPQFWAEC